MPLPRFGNELLVHAVPAREGSLIRQGVEKFMTFVAAGSMRLAGIVWFGNATPSLRVPRRDGSAAEVAVPHRLSWHRRPASAKDGLVVRPLIVAEEEQLLPNQWSAKTRAPAMLVRVRQRISTFRARERLVVGEGIQTVGIEVIERRPAVPAAAALRRDDDPRQPAVYRRCTSWTGPATLRPHRGPARSCRSYRRSHSWRPVRPGCTTLHRSCRPRTECRCRRCCPRRSD